MTTDNATPGSGRAGRLARRAAAAISALAVILAFLILLVRLLTHFPIFEEAVNAHYLWLTASGLRPQADFFCFYPAFGYLLTAPYLRLFPDSAFVLLALRALSLATAGIMGLLFYFHGRRTAGSGAAGLLPFLLVIASPGVSSYVVEYSVDHLAALAAIGALYLILGQGGSRSLAAAMALSVVSAVAMPKYIFPLAFGMAGALAKHYLLQRNARVLALAMLAGAGSALLAIVLVYVLGGAPLIDDLRYTHLLQYRQSAATGYFGRDLGPMRPLLSSVGEFLLRNPLYGIVAAAGITGWVLHARRSRLAGQLGGWGILAGMFLSMIILRGHLEQYLAPVLLCAALFVPYAFTATRSPRLQEAGGFLLALGTAGTLAAMFVAAAPDFRETLYNCRADTEECRREVQSIDKVKPGIFALAAYEDLLTIIPRDEQVVAVWPYHPILRKDLTFIAADDNPSFRSALPPGDPLLRRFDPELFRQALEARPPAGIALYNLERNYPPGWDVEAVRFLERNADRYARYRNGPFEMFIRKDLQR